MVSNGKKPTFKTCSRCGQTFGPANFSPTKSPFYPEGLLPICNDCLVEVVMMKGDLKDWKNVDKVCQWLDVPFVPTRWLELYEKQGAKAIIPYIRIFSANEYEGIDWTAQQEIYKKLQENDVLTAATVPGYSETQLQELKVKWGANYSEEDLGYLENLYKGILSTQSINGVLQTDQALKLCKLSLAIDSAIRSGENIDKLLGSYEKIIKVGEFTPKNIKNAQDFDSVGELVAYLEKTGWVNKFYDNVPRDIVDVTMQNIQNFCQRLYTQEPGIGEDIDKRIESLKSAQAIEDNMGLIDDYTTYTDEEISEEVNTILADQTEFSPEVDI